MKTMKNWNRSIKNEDIRRNPKVAMKMHKIKSDDLFDTVFLKNIKDK